MSRLDDRFVEEVKQRLRLSDIVSRTVKLKRQGREFAGLSPFNQERTPSFFVNDDKGFWHCFSSGKHGDAIDFLVETQRMGFREAVEQLASEAGLQMPADDPKHAQVEQRRRGLIDWLEASATWYEGQLRRPVGEPARIYLEGRGVPADEWGRFRIGFAPADRTALKDAMLARGAALHDLVEAGLLIQPEDGGAPYDRFRNRVMFPIADARGRVVSFSGRALDPGQRSKYLNGPETPAFSKGALLYGLGEARRLMGVTGGDAALVAVEGCMDAIACHRAGVAAVAPLGTAMTEDQLELLWRAHPEPTLCFDGDAAGQRAARGAIDRALPRLRPGRSLRFTMLRDRMDPDDLLRRGGAAGLRSALSKPLALVTVLFELERRATPLDTPEQRQALRERLLRAANTVQDEGLSQTYRTELMRRAEPLINPPRRAFRGPAPALSTAGRDAAQRLGDELDPLCAAVLQHALQRPEWVDANLDLTASTSWPAALAPVVQDLLDHRFSETIVPLERVLRAKGHDAALERVASAAARSGRRFADCGSWVDAMRLTTTLIRLDDAIEDARDQMATDPNRAADLVRLKAERDALRRQARA